MPPRGRRAWSTGRWRWLAAGAAALVVLGALGLVLSRNGSTTSPPSTAGASRSESRSASTGSHTSKSSAPSLTPKQKRAAAYHTLQHMVAADARKDPVRGQWVAQLASKYEGVVDKRQQSTPFTVPQILAEVNRARHNPEYGSTVRVLHQGDWAGSTAGSRVMWVTVADLDLTSRDEVVTWCRHHFRQRGAALLDVCYPRQLLPK